MLVYILEIITDTRARTEKRYFEKISPKNKKTIGKKPINYVLKISLSSPSRSNGHYLSLFSLQSKCYKICIKTDRLTLLFAKEI